MQSRAVLNRIIVSTASIAPSLAFYRDIVGLGGPSQLSDVGGADGPAAAVGFATLTVADGVELLLHERPAVPSDTSVAASFVVPDVDAVVRSWEAEGGVVVDQPSDRPWGERQAVVRDPDGHLVCLASPVAD